MVAYACRISEENFDAIASEKPDFDLNETLQWLDQNGTGFFLRDETSALDCAYLVDENFFQMYLFDSSDTHELFRRVLKI